MAYNGFVILNAQDATYRGQAQAYKQDFQILAEALRGNGLISGGVLTQQGSPDMSVHVSGGQMQREGVLSSFSAADPAITAAHASLDRIDIVSVTNVGGIVATTGTAAIHPVPPEIPQSGGINNIVLGFVYVAAAITAITTVFLTDKRALVNVVGENVAFEERVSGPVALTYQVEDIVATITTSSIPVHSVLSLTAKIGCTGVAANSTIVIFRLRKGLTTAGAILDESNALVNNAVAQYFVTPVQALDDDSSADPSYVLTAYLDAPNDVVEISQVAFQAVVCS